MKWMMSLVLSVVGCAGAPGSNPEPATPPVAAPAPVVAAPAPVAEAPALVVVSDAHRQIAEGPSGGQPVTVTGRSGENRIDVVIEHIVSYCAPDPTFTATANATANALELRLVRPTEGVSRCFGTHHVEAHVDIPGRNGLQKVVVQDADGKTLAEATIGA